METKKLEELRSSIPALTDIDFYFPCEVEYLVLGTSKEEVVALRDILFDEEFAEIFAHHLAYFNKGLMSYDKFIESLMWWLDMMRKAKDSSNMD